MKSQELGSCSSVCDAFIWGAVGGVPDALETLFARTVFGGYEGGTSWGGAWLEHEGGSFYVCVYMVCATVRVDDYGSCFCVCGFALGRAFICGGAALGGGMGMLCVYEKGAALTAVPFCEVFLSLYILVALFHAIMWRF